MRIQGDWNSHASLVGMQNVYTLREEFGSYRGGEGKKRKEFDSY